MAKHRSSAQPSQSSLPFPADRRDSAPESSKTAREELRRIITVAGRQKSVGIHVYGVKSGEQRIHRALLLDRDHEWAAFDIDDVVGALHYLREELGEQPVVDALTWLCGDFGYRPEKIETRTLEQRVEQLEDEAAEDAKLEAALSRRKAKRRDELVGVVRELDRRKDGV